MLKKCLLAAVLSLSLSAQVFAHDFFIEKKDGAYYVVSGHENNWEAYDPSRIKEVKAYNTKGKKVTAKISRKKDIVSIAPGKQVAAVTVFMDNKFWVKSTEGWKNITKREALKQSLQLLENGESYKYGKYIETWSNRFAKPLGTKIEVIPLTNPLAMKEGDVLEVQVLLDGKPLPNAPISIKGSHSEIGKTDKNGVARIPIGKAGQNVISVSTQVPYKNNPDADQLYLKATLAFEVK